jgi:hypothetical protein
VQLVKVGPSLEGIFQIFRKSSKLNFFEHSFNKDKSVDQKNIRHKKGMKFALIVELEQLNFINITTAKKKPGPPFQFWLHLVQFSIVRDKTKNQICFRSANQKLQDTNDGLVQMVDISAIRSPRLSHRRMGSDQRVRRQGPIN